MNLSNKLKSRNEKANPVAAIVAALFIMYIISGILLLFLALLLYKMELGESVIKMAVIVIYLLSGIAGGFFAGKKMKDRKFLWGLLAGVAYFVLLFVISAIAKQGVFTGSLGQDSTELVKTVTTFILCAASGMVGGMVS